MNTPAIIAAKAAACLFYAAAAALNEEEKDEIRKRKLWIKERRKNRKQFNNTHNLFNELKTSVKEYTSFSWMDESCFNFILSAIKNDIQKQDTLMREAVTPEEKLAVTIRFLVTGESFTELDQKSKLSITFLSRAIMETCEAIYNNMKHEFLKFPANEEEWSNIANEFERKWQFPLCIGALGCKHIAFKPSKKEAPLFYNFKGFHSIVLLATVDANAKFIFVDVGRNGGVSNRDVLQLSDLIYVIQNSDKYFPRKKIIGKNRLLPYVFVAENTYPLLENLMIPYPITTIDQKEKIYNNRLNRSRQTIDFAFRILSDRFKIFQKKINLNANKAKTIVLCCCVLHNFLMTKSSCYAEIKLSDVNTVQENTINANVKDYSSEMGENSNKCEEIRRNWMEYFNNEGKI